ncbi:MAG: hypothetical protein SFX18_18890 [Pirellulales bacterium]|nr:hypothetical protein [Pirellulales bacterium]
MPDQILLRANHRLAWGALVFPLLLFLIAAVTCGWGITTNGTLVVGLGILGLLLALAWGGLVWLQLRQPVVVLKQDRLQFYLPGPQPIEVPLEVAECALLGTGVTELPGAPRKDVQTRNIVFKLAESAEEYAHRDMPLALGKWCMGEVTIRGLYCEPLNLELIQRINQTLYDAQQGAK